MHSTVGPILARLVKYTIRSKLNETVEDNKHGFRAIIGVQDAIQNLF